MNKTMKTIFKQICSLVLLLSFMLSLSSCSLLFHIYNPFSLFTSDFNLNEYRLPYGICRAVLGTDPQTFCETNGKETLLENRYVKASVTEDNVLILQLTDSQVESWKNSDVYLQILQKLVGEEKKVVSKSSPPSSPIFKVLYDEVDSCGIEVSDDYTKILAEEDDSRLFYAHILQSACLTIQLISGKPIENILVEYTVRNSKGILIEHIILPWSTTIFQDLDECKQLMTYEQIPSDIYEHTDSEKDPYSRNLQYDSFWGMDYHSENMKYEIFAYEFLNKDDALRYYINVTGETDHANKIPLDESDKNPLWLRIFGENSYQIVAIKENKAYRLQSSGLLTVTIEDMLTTVFSIEV